MNNKKIIVIVGKPDDKLLHDEIRDNLVKAYHGSNPYDIAYPTVGAEKVLKISPIHNKRNNKRK